MVRFPVIISIPHGGIKIPDELKDRICISNHDIFWDIDAFSHDIYDLGKNVCKVIKTNIARTFVDVNRSISHMPPEYTDGLIKSVSSFNKQIYFNGKAPDDQLIKTLLQRYYEPYHKKIQNVLENKAIKFGLDCHSMLKIGPPISTDRGEKRPLICLGNVGGSSCSTEMVKTLAACLKRGFQIEKERIAINNPFSGGYITQTYGNKPVPWVQVEISRELYLEEPWFNNQTLRISNDRLVELRCMFKKSIDYFVECDII